MRIFLFFFLLMMSPAFCMDEGSALLTSAPEDQPVTPASTPVSPPSEWRETLTGLRRFLCGRCECVKGCKECAHGKFVEGYINCEQGLCPCFFNSEEGCFRNDLQMGRIVCCCSLLMGGLAGAGIYGIVHPNGWFR